MERLTEWSYLAGIMTGDLKEGVDERKAFDRLAAYEDTGLEPKEVKEFLEDVESRFVLWINKRYGIPAMKFMDIMQAEKDGRLVVLPVKPYLTPTQQNEMYICENGEVWAIYVTGCEAGPNSDGVFTVLYNTVDGYGFSTDDIGKTVFLNREEAEAALKKEDADNDS